MQQQAIQAVDVLGVMNCVRDGINARLSPEHASWDAEVGKARAAIAELVEAVRAGREVQTHNGPVLRYDELQSERLAVALAGVGGAK